MPNALTEFSPMPATATETQYETITFDVADHICTITLNRPDVYNALNDQLTDREDRQRLSNIS